VGAARRSLVRAVVFSLAGSSLYAVNEVASRMAFSEQVLKHAPWSFSKAGTIGLCPRQFYKRYVERKPDRSNNAKSKVGSAVHRVIEDALREPELSTDALMEAAAEAEHLTTEEAVTARTFLPNIDRYLRWDAAFCLKHGVVKKLIEFEGAILPDFTPTHYDDPRAVLRGRIDRGFETKNADMVISDHKSGKRKTLDEHQAQLNIYRVFVVACYPHIRSVQPFIHYVETGKLDWDKPMTAAQVRARLFPWVEHYLNKHHYTLLAMEKGTPDANKGWQCEYCGFPTAAECGEGQAHVVARVAERERKNPKSLPIVDV
jgi:CRISPR/Cas system-associated exonuclease Cas4 (RecB family)